MAVLAGGLAVRTVIGFGHIEQGHTLLEMGGLFFLTGAGGVTFAWLVYRWRNLWVAIALHICINLWWNCSPSRAPRLAGGCRLRFRI
jgi:membrane protease YdiL (CAAX protease family)